jgi:tRNA (guanosine-2'-O-)-methyltransferase
MRPTRFARICEVLDRRQPDLTVLMDRVSKTHNFSAVLRTCDAVGVLEVHVVPPTRGLALHHDTSAGTGKWMVVHRHTDGAAAARALKEAGFRIVAADPAEASTDFRGVDYTLPTAVLLGAELFGVSDGALEQADVRIRIPMTGMARSLNVSVAAALVLYEAQRQREKAGLYEHSRLEASRRAALLFEWTHPKLARALRETGHAYPELDESGEVRSAGLPDQALRD